MPCGTAEIKKLNKRRDIHPKNIATEFEKKILTLVLTDGPTTRHGNKCSEP